MGFSFKMLLWDKSAPGVSFVYVCAYVCARHLEYLACARFMLSSTMSIHA